MPGGAEGQPGLRGVPAPGAPSGAAAAPSAPAARGAPHRTSPLGARHMQMSARRRAPIGRRQAI